MKDSLFSPKPIALRRGRTASKQTSRSLRAEAWLQILAPAGRGSGQRVAEELDQKPLVGMVLAVLLIFSVLTYQLTNLQIVNGERYQGLADGNRLRSQITYAQRGQIFDRNGVALVENIPSFQLVATPYLLPKDAAQRQQLYQTIARYSGGSAAEVQQTVEKNGLEQNQPLLIKDNISYEQALQIEQKLPDLTGFSLDAVPLRRYKSEGALAHILGYVGRVNEAELKSHQGLLPVDFIGKDGVENQYDALLRGQNGVVENEVDSMGRPVRTLANRPTQPGKDITLTVDYELQKQFAAAIAEQMPRAGAKRAAGVAMNPKTGEILASVSLPAYDDNLFAGGISQTALNQLSNDANQPLVNKAIGGVFPSGSIIKPLHLAGALQEGVVNENTTFVDSGQITVPSEFDPAVVYTFKGWQPGGLGPMNARRAIAMSSDIYFYTVGGGYRGFKGLGVERLTKYYKLFGLGEATGIDLPGEAAGRVPTPEWKKETKGEDWFVGDTYNISIGQGDLLTSPLQMVVSEAAIINGGKVLEPHVLKQASDAQPVAPKVVREGFVKPEYYKIVREGMRQVIGGTTSVATFASVGVPVAGKSGTAETDPEAKAKPHAWYVAFAPYDNPEIIFSVILEGGEGGSQFAAPAIAKTMQWYFSPVNKQRGR